MGLLGTNPPTTILTGSSISGSLGATVKLTCAAAPEIVATLHKESTKALNLKALMLEQLTHGNRSSVAILTWILQGNALTMLAEGVLIFGSIENQRKSNLQSWRRVVDPAVFLTLMACIPVRCLGSARTVLRLVSLFHLLVFPVNPLLPKYSVTSSIANTSRQNPITQN